MLKQSYVLSSKIKIAAKYDKRDYAGTQYHFYSKYSLFVLKALKRKSFQEFLDSMLKKEDIKEANINAVKIEVFPAPRRNGFNIAGKCNTCNGRIRIYPKNIKFCHAFREEFGKSTLVSYAGNRARASLIHELLHLKYISDEEQVRELTKIYFTKYEQQFDKKSNSISIYQLLFYAKSLKLGEIIKKHNEKIKD